MQVEVDHMVAVTRCASLQMFNERLKGSGAHDVDLDAKLRIAQTFNQRTGDRSVCDVVLTFRTGSNGQHINQISHSRGTVVVCYIQDCPSNNGNTHRER